MGFGNARAVRNAFERVLAKQAARVLAERRQGQDPDTLHLTREGFLGPKFLDTSSSSALRDLEAMRGLPAVKMQVMYWCRDHAGSSRDVQGVEHGVTCSV